MVSTLVSSVFLLVTSFLMCGDTGFCSVTPLKYSILVHNRISIPLNVVNRKCRKTTPWIFRRDIDKEIILEDGERYNSITMPRTKDWILACGSGQNFGYGTINGICKTLLEKK